MLANFVQMPGFLKFLTSMAIICVLSVVLSILPGDIDIFGQHISTSDWWSNGSGFIFAISLIPIFCSGLLILKRARYSRIVHIIGWVFADIGVLAVAVINHVTMPMDIEYVYVGFSIVSIIVFAAYLYFNKRVRVYFGRTLN